jgi:Fic family protein
MFNPQYRIGHSLIGSLERIASLRKFFENAPPTAVLKLTLERDSFNRSVHSSTWIEGNVLSLAQVAALSANKNVNAEEKEKREVTNCVKALRWVLGNKKNALTEARLLTLHKKMTKGLLPDSRCGSYRNVPNYIVNAKNKIIFTPPPPEKVKSEMKELFVWLNKNPKEHPIIRSAVFHHKFVSIHPFVDGNGRVVRTGAQWILFNAQYDSVWTLGLDEFFAGDRAKYYDMIQQTHEMDGDYTYWIEYFVQGLVHSIETMTSRVNFQKGKKKNISFTPKQEELLRFIEQNGSLGSAQICQGMNINRARVNQLISPLVKAGIVVMSGITRAVKYRIK